MNVLIVEDEPKASERLKRLLEDMNTGIKVLGIVTSCKSAIDWFNQNSPPDLVFMDIQLSDGKSFEIFEQLEVSAPVIFTTGFDSYAIKAFEYNSIAYLLKPVDKEQLATALNKFNQIGNPGMKGLSTLIESLEQKEYRSRFMVTSGEKLVLVEIEDIAYFFGQDKYAYLHTFQDQRHLVDEPLKDLELNLDPSTFFRVNRQYIINVKAIKEMFSYSKGRVRMVLDPPSNESIIVSTEKSSVFKKWLQR